MGSAALNDSSPGFPRSASGVDAASRGLILLVDDEQSIARAYARTLGAAGFAVELAFDGKEAASAAPAPGGSMLPGTSSAPGHKLRVVPSPCI